jgi:hypothetical protein
MQELWGYTCQSGSIVFAAIALAVGSVWQRDVYLVVGMRHLRDFDENQSI